MDANPIYINNTIVYNTASYGGGFYCKDSISPDFYNTIFWGNTAGVGPTGYLFEVYSQADFFNCDVEGGPSLFGGSGGGEAFFGAYEQCINEDPEFEDNGEFPYGLTWDSPCYDAGSGDTTGFLLPEVDLAGNPRLSHSAIDIGAYEIVWIGIGENKDINENVKVWPNPFSDHFNVELVLEGEGPVLIQVFDITGRKVSEIYKEDIIERKNQFQINLTGREFTGEILLLRISHRDELYSSTLIKCFSQSNTK
jgi:hypothetical protein